MCVTWFDSSKQTLSVQNWKIPSSFQVEIICIYNSKIDNDSSINNVYISPVTSGRFMQKSFKTYT